MSSLFIMPFAPVLTLTGAIAPEAVLTFYESETTTLAPIYDNSGDALENPLKADNYGRFPGIFLDDAVVYRIRLETKAGVLLGEVDPYNAQAGPNTAGVLFTDFGGVASTNNADAAGNSAVLRSILDQGFRTIIFPDNAGSTTYMFNPVNIPESGVTMIGIGHQAKLKYNTTFEGDALFAFRADGVRLENLWFEGNAYTTFGDGEPINNRLVLIQAPTVTVPYSTVSDIQIGRCHFYGAVTGLYMTAAEDFTVTDCEFDMQWTNGLAIPLGPRKGIIDGFRAYNTATSEGLKFGFSANNTAPNDAGRIVITNFIIQNCGVLDPDRDNWQEGMDLYVQNLAYVHISNGFILDCGNGGIEIKSGGTPVPTQGIQKGVIDNVTVRIKYARGIGFNFGWTGTPTSGDPTSPLPIAPNMLGNWQVNNCTVYWEGDASEAALIREDMCLQMAAWTDVRIFNLVGKNTRQFARLAGTGSTDATVRRVTFEKCHGRGIINYGINHQNGGNEELTAIDCDIESGDYPFLSVLGVNGKPAVLTRVIGGRYICTDTDTAGSTGAIRIDAALGAMIKGVYAEAQTRVISVGQNTPADTSGYATPKGGWIDDCILVTRETSDSGSFNVYYANFYGGGVWRYENCTLKGRNDSYGANIQESTDVRAYNLLRGFTDNVSPATLSPTVRGSRGDYFANKNPGSSGAYKWINVVDSSTWRAIG